MSKILVKSKVIDLLAMTNDHQLVWDFMTRRRVEKRYKPNEAAVAVLSVE